METDDEFEWTSEQRNALDEISIWQRRPDRQIFRLFGFAGTGKTTLTREIARRCGGNVLFAAFTGKAALVMRQMGCYGAKTIHSIIYTPLSELVEEAKALRRWLSEDEISEHAKGEALQRWGTTDPRELARRLAVLRKKIEAGPDWILRDELKGDPELFIVDECSMVGEELARDLMGFGIPILVIGDPFQLPPVKGAGYFTDAEPDAMLREVHRQALGSPVTRMATTVRQVGAWALKPGTYGDSRYLRATADETAGLILDADQVLCGRHVTRHRYNAVIRAARGFTGPVPLPGEKLLCCRNNKTLGLLNGSLWTVVRCIKRNGFLYADIEPLDGGEVIEQIRMHAEPFTGCEVLPEDKFDAHEFDWGYVLTVHKSQGSQWPHVALINDGWSGPDNFLDHWLYTALTRAQERVTVIKPMSAARQEMALQDFLSMKPKPKRLANRR
jgi:ATP-dependent exoDNAse (exonuclease V) alpha subunit